MKYRIPFFCFLSIFLSPQAQTMDITVDAASGLSGSGSSFNFTQDLGSASAVTGAIAISISTDVIGKYT